MPGEWHGVEVSGQGGYAVGAMPPQIDRDQPRITAGDHLSMIFAGLDDLMEQVDVLENRLGPALIPAPDSDVPALPPAPGASSPLVSQLEQVRVGMARAISRLAEIRARVEL